MVEHHPSDGLSGSGDRGVSPVIGVILMVAITVILATLVGAFVLDLGQQAENDSPQASFQVSAYPAANQIELEHLGGDELRQDETRVLVESGGTTRFDAVDAGSGDVLSVGNTALITLNDSGDDDRLDFTSDGTDEVTVDGGADSFSPDDRITIILIDTETERVIFQRTLLVQD